MLYRISGQKCRKWNYSRLEAIPLSKCKPYVKKRHFRGEKFPYLEKNLQLLGLDYLKAQLVCLRRKRAFYGEKIPIP